MNSLGFFYYHMLIIIRFHCNVQAVEYIIHIQVLSCFWLNNTLKCHVHLVVVEFNITIRVKNSLYIRKAGFYNKICQWKKDLELHSFMSTWMRQYLNDKYLNNAMPFISPQKCHKTINIPEMNFFIEF